MAAMTNAPTSPRAIAIDRIRVTENVRALNHEHIDAPAGSGG